MRIYKENRMVTKSINTIEDVILSNGFFRFLENLYDFQSNPFTSGVDCAQMNVDICHGINLCSNISSVAKPIIGESFSMTEDNGRKQSDSPYSSVMFEFNNKIYALKKNEHIQYSKTNAIPINNVSTISGTPSDKMYRIRDYITEMYYTERLKVKS